jgi:hypothetical protein
VICDAVNCYLNAAAAPATDPFWASVILLVFGEGADANTTFTDHSTPAHVMTANGNVQHDTGQDVHGQSIMFDGTTDYITTPDATDLRLAGSNTTSVCLECYAYITSNAHINQLMEKRIGGTANDYEFFVDVAGKLNYKSYGAGATRCNVISTNAVPLNTIVHLAMVRDGSTHTVYVFIDGVLEGSGNDANGGNAASTFNLGHSGRTAGQDFQGWANWFRITRGVTRYSIAGFTPPTTPFPTS